MINADNPEHIRHWAKLCKTDPDYTKNFTRPGGFKGTDISPAYRIQRMTEEFGPCGEGWGHTVHRTWRENFPGKQGEAICVFAEVSIWWRGKDGERHETGQQIGGSIADRAPDEAYKMAITDGLSKCMLFLGMSADVYLGLYDDAKYIRQLQQEFADPPPGASAPSGPPKNGHSPEDKYTHYSKRLGISWTSEWVAKYTAEISGENDPALSKQLEPAMLAAVRRVELLSADEHSVDDDEVTMLCEQMAPAIEAGKKNPQLRGSLDTWWKEVEPMNPNPFTAEQLAKLKRCYERQVRKHVQPAGAR